MTRKEDLARQNSRRMRRRRRPMRTARPAALPNVARRGR